MDIGLWVSLSVHTLAAGTGNTITLSGTGANGTVVADAIYVVPTPAAPPPDAFTWTPSVPAAADYEIHARWTAASDRASNAQYVIDNGTSSVPVAVAVRIRGTHT